MIFIHFRQLRAVLRNHSALTALVLSASLLLALLNVFSAFPQFVESFYSRRLYARIAGILSTLSAALPFSLSEILLYLAIFFSLFGSVLGLWRRRFRRTAFLWFAGATLIVLWFYLAWGINYYRPKLEQQLQFANVEPDSVILRENFLWCIAGANAAWQPTSPWHLQELNDEIERDYAEVSVEINLPDISGGAKVFVDAGAVGLHAHLRHLWTILSRSASQLASAAGGNAVCAGA
jgi:hypothetical protein